jgi:hypothetical protein
MRWPCESHQTSIVTLLTASSPTDACLYPRTLLPPPDLTAVSTPSRLHPCQWPCNSNINKLWYRHFRPLDFRASTSPCLQRPSRPLGLHRHAYNECPDLQVSMSPCLQRASKPPNLDHHLLQTMPLPPDLTATSRPPNLHARTYPCLHTYILSVSACTNTCATVLVAVRHNRNPTPNSKVRRHSQTFARSLAASTQPSLPPHLCCHLHTVTATSIPSSLQSLPAAVQLHQQTPVTTLQTSMPPRHHAYSGPSRLPGRHAYSDPYHLLKQLV